MLHLYYLITFLLVISLAIIIYGLMKGKKLFTCILKVVVIFVVIGMSACQEDSEITVSGDKPIVIPDAMTKAAFLLDYWFEEFMWRGDISFFLSDNFTSYLNNNSSQVTI